MWLLALVGFYVAVPLASLVCLATGAWLRGRCPTWLLAVATVPPLIFAVVAIIAATMDFSLIAVWMAVACGLLVWAMAAASRGRPGRRLCALVGMAIPAPAMAFVLTIGITTLWYVLFGGLS